jgi:hypothetical protein
MKYTALASLALVSAMLAGCVETTTVGAGGSSDVPLSDVDACESAVAQAAGTSQVRTLATEFSQANNMVTVGVGPNAAPWSCLVSGGRVAAVTSMSNEGSL